MLTERRRAILEALISEYIALAQPVGSKSLTERHVLGCSAATVRNELAVLEETGYLYQPHVSAGRVPTDAGYRSYVDALLGEPAQQEMLREEVRADLTAHVVELDHLMRDASVVLSSITHCMAVVLAPTVTFARINRVNVVSLVPRRLLVVLITDSGQVIDRQIELPEDANPARVIELERSMNAGLIGKRAAEVRSAKEGLGNDLLAVFVANQVAECLDEADRDRLHHIGIAELLDQPEFHDPERVRPLMIVLEDGVALLDTVSEALADDDVAVRIGHENVQEGLGNVSLVVKRYSSPGAEGAVGVIGPTRMNYGLAIGAVKSVADTLTELLG